MPGTRSSILSGSGGDGVEAAAPDGDDAVERSPADAGREAAEKAGRGTDPRLTAEELSEATAYFLSDDADEVVASDTFDLNVAPVGTQLVPWTVKALDRGLIDSIQKAARMRRRGGGAQEIDGMTANLRIATIGTLDPDLERIRVERDFGKKEEALRWALRHKSGLIDQIAVRILELSGWDDDDLRERVKESPDDREVRTAGN